MSLHRYHETQLGASIYPHVRMQGGSLIRYRTPMLTQRGSGMEEAMLKVAGPSVVTALHNTMRDVQQGKSLKDSVAQHGRELKRNLKRKAPRMALEAGKYAATQRYKKAKRRVRDIFTWPS